MKRIILQMTMIMSISVCGFTQGGPPAPAFEVVSIKASAPQPIGSTEVSFQRDPGRLTFTGATVRDVLAKAYSLQPAQISGPAWIDEDRYDISAKIPAGMGPDQVPAMLQQMMDERFKIVAHRESKEQPVYGLVVAKGGAKLKKSGDHPDIHTAGAAQIVGEGYSSGRVWNGPGAPPPPPIDRDITSATGRMKVHGVTLTLFAKNLSGHLDRPVIDMTGIPGEYDFDFAGNSDYASELRAYGLSLESRKAAVDVLSIDRAQRHPTEN